MTQDTRITIFISYSRADALFVEQLVPLLKEVFPEYDIWFDQYITGGDDWWQDILAAIRRSDLFIYLLSNDSIGSEYCQAEFREALRLQKLCLPVIVRPKTQVEQAPADLEAEIRRRNWIDMGGGFKDATANARLFRAVRWQINKIPAQPSPPLAPDPVIQPRVSHVKPPSASTISPNRLQIIVALIGAAALIVAALIGIVPGMLNLAQQTAKTTPTVNPTIDSTAVVGQPTTGATFTMTATATASPTVDFDAAAKTFDAQSTAAVKATSLAQTQAWIAGQTSTATLWTQIPTPTATLTPNITASFEAFLTQRANTQAAQEAAYQTATATRWTKTPTATSTHTDTPTLIATSIPTTTPTVMTNKMWTPISKTFEDGVEMVQVPPGCFQMGSNDGHDDEKPVTAVCFDQPFWIDKYEVTNGQFNRLRGEADRQSNLTDDQRPREEITWFEARNFCKKRGARLPTEAEWEYAARGPDGWVYPWGDSWNGDNAIYDHIAGYQTVNVGSKPGGISWVGAFDMAGNVWEWTGTVYQPYPYKADAPRNPDNQLVVRGGSWEGNAATLRSALRTRNIPSFQDNTLGFRCARS